MDSRLLRQFLNLADALHFGKASEASHVSPSALSRSIRQLEAEVGVALFARNNRTVTLTHEGKLFLPYAREALTQWDAIRNTLMAEADGKPVRAVVPSAAEVSMTKLAAAFGAKAAKMMRPADSERLTRYPVRRLSPFGQKKRVPVAIEATALGHATVFLNGGQRGLQVELDPREAVRLLEAIARPLTA